MGIAASVRDDRSPDQTSGSVRTKFFFKPPLEFGFSKSADYRNPLLGVKSGSSYETTVKDIQSPIEIDSATHDEKFSKDIFDRSATIDGQHKVHLTESGRQSLMTFIKAE
jgi:hypothetical protein